MLASSHTAPVPPPQAATQAAPAAIASSTAAASPILLPGFHRSAYFGEQVREEWNAVAPGVRVLWNAPGVMDPARPTRLIVYATPNGNTAEQTLGCALAPNGDWHVDIQHIAAQARRLRAVTPGENVVLAVVQSDTLSWPAWRATRPDNPARIRALVDALVAELTVGPSPAPVRVTLVAHSGGGSFLFGFLNGGDTPPTTVDRIAFLDANYSYSDADGHGDKLVAWLAADPTRHLIVIAYDDRNITIGGKKVVGADGGTFRATYRMIDRLTKDRPLVASTTGEFTNWTDATGQIVLHIHANPENKILHTALVGEMNGFLEAMTEGDKSAAPWGTFGGPRAYTNCIQSAPGIPPRPADAPGGAAFMASIANLSPAAREEAIAQEIGRGNLPDFLRTFKTIPVTTTGESAHTATIDVMPDYLAVGSDTDFVRVPVTPQTAQRLADAFGCTLPTRKMVDDIYRAADVKLEPRPMTEAREAVATFVAFNTIIEAERAGHPLGLLVAGIKKDVVVTNRLREKPNRVAIYGWHKLDGMPIQPLTIVHRDTYLDYSHGIRLVRRAARIDGKPRDLHAALHYEAVCALFSDEGVLEVPAY